jgi:hypothetical protein
LEHFMRKHRLLVPFLSVTLACAAYACGGDDSSPDDHADSGTADSGKTDAHTGHDGSLVDASTDDAQADTSTPDTGTDTSTPDAGTPDTGTDTSTPDTGADTSTPDTGADTSAPDTGADTSAPDTGADAADSTAPDASDAGSDASDGASVIDAPIDVGLPDAAGLAPSVYVLRLGDGNAALTGAATAGFLEQVRITDGTVLSTIPLPVAASGSNQPITFSGTATSEGELGLSVDEHYVVLAGYAAVPGTAAVVATPSSSSDGGTFVRRVVARVAANGTIDTSTQLEGAFSGNNVRGAATLDGSGFWVSGTGSSTTGGVHYVGLGLTGTTTQIAATPANARHTNVFGGQLYVTSGSANFVGVNSIGAGTPTTSGQPSALLLAGQSISAYGFVGLDTDSTAGIDVLYVTDDRAAPDGGTLVGGVQKWTLSGQTWTPGVTWNSGLTGGVRGLTAFVNGSVVTLVGTTADNKLVTAVDNGTTPPVFVPILTAATNTAFRGVARVPN